MNESVSARAAALERRWRALARRERALLVVAVVACVLAIGDLLFLEPALKDRARLLRQIDEQAAARQALDASAGQAAHDPDAAARRQLETLRAQLRDTEHEFGAMQNGLVQPQHMGALLQSLLAEQHGLRLLALRSLPVTAIDAGGATKGDRIGDKSSDRQGDRASDKTSDKPAADKPAGRRDDAWLYRHAVEVRVEGSYADMLAYLRAIEALPRRVRWGDVEIDARAYPANTMTVTLYTVSLDQTWWVL